jgi:hypothetical protein
MVVVVGVFTPDHGSKPHWIYHKTIQPSHSSWAGCQAVYQYLFTSLSQGTGFFLYMQEQSYSANDCREDFMMKYNEMICAVRESNTGRPIHSHALPVSLTRRLVTKRLLRTRFILDVHQTKDKTFKKALNVLKVNNSYRKQMNPPVWCVALKKSFRHSFDCNW